MNKLLSFGVVGILLLAPIAIYTVQDQRFQTQSYRERCEMLSMQYELLRARELLQTEKDKVAGGAPSRDLDRMKEQVEALECRLEGMNALVDQNARDLSRIDSETAARIQEKTGEISTGLKTVEGRWAKEIDRIANTLSSASDLQKNTLTEVQSLLNRSPEEMEGSMVLPTIQLNGVDTVGSGILIYSQPDRQKGAYVTYALTSYHVVRNILAESEGAQKPQIRVNTYEGKSPREEIADVVVYDEDNDMALLRLRTDRAFERVAKVLPKERSGEIKVFTPIYAVGCPLGNDPIPTVGEIASVRNVINGQNYWMLNAPTYFGNSGGGIYLARTHELIGVFSKIYTHGHGRPVVISHMGLATPIDTVHAWLDKVGYGFLVAPVGAAEAASGK